MDLLRFPKIKQKESPQIIIKIKCTCIFTYLQVFSVFKQIKISCLYDMSRQIIPLARNPNVKRMFVWNTLSMFNKKIE